MVHVTGVRVGEIGGAEFRGQQVLWVLPKALGFFCSFLCFLFWSHLLERHMDLETERVAAPSPSHLLYPSHGGGDNIHIRDLLWEGPSKEEYPRPMCDGIQL